MVRACLACVGLLVLASGARAQEEFEETLDTIPDLFAGVLGVTLSEEISGAALRVEGVGNAEDTHIQTLRAPWHDDFRVPGLHGALHLEAVAGLMRAQDEFGTDTASGFATVRQDWTLVGAQIGAGWGFPLGSSWWLRPGATLALSYLENDARYNEAGRIELAPLIDGLLVNWDGWAMSPAANLTVERVRDPLRLDGGFEARYSLARTRVFEASDAAQERRDSSRTLAARAALGAPTARDPQGGLRSAWDVFAGGVRFLDFERDALGFDGLLELGLGWTQDFPRLPPLRFEAAWLVGADVRGYSLGVSLTPHVGPDRPDP
jgi:hypothetical protein